MATAPDKTPRGGDREFQITVTDPIAGTPIDLDTPDGVDCILYYKGDGRDHVLQTYSLNDSSVELLTIEDGPNGILSVKLQSKTTDEAQLGDLYAEVKTETAVGGWDGGKKHEVFRDILVTQIIESLTADRTDLT